MTIKMNDLVDFTYCGKKLSDFSCIIGGVTANTGIEAMDLGNKLNMNPIALPFLKKQKSVYPTYDDMLTATISIIKDPCEGSLYFTQAEAKAILRWLNQPVYREFVPEYSDENWMVSTHYYVTFNVQPLVNGSNVCGFSLEMNSNAPFGYYDKVEITNNTSSLVVNDTSDEQGYQYPIVELTVTTDGTVVLLNSADNRYTLVDNCVAGEVLTFDGEKGIITSSEEHEKLYSDFNYFYPRIVNSMNDDGSDLRTNTYTIRGGAANITKFEYTPICKIEFV